MTEIAASSYTTLEMALRPYNRTLLVVREEQYASGIIIPKRVMKLSKDEDLSKLTVPDGLILPSYEDVAITVAETGVDGEQIQHDNLNELYGSLERFVAEAIITSARLGVEFSEQANQSEIEMMQRLKPQSVEHHYGMYL